MAMHGRGLICLALTEEQVDRLELPMMSAPGRGGPPLGTAFTVSIEASDGRHDRHQRRRPRSYDSRRERSRARSPTTSSCPGHIFPLVAARVACWCAPDKPKARSIWRGSPVSPRPESSARSSRTTARWRACPTSSCSPSGTVCGSDDRGLDWYRLQTERFVEPSRRVEIVLDRTGTAWPALCSRRRSISVRSWLS